MPMGRGPGVMAQPRWRAPLASASREPPVVGLVIRDLNDHDVSFSAVTNDRVEQPPERRQILDVEVLQAIRVSEDARDAILFHDLTVQTVGEEDGTEGSNSSCNRRGAAGRIPFEATQMLGCGRREDDIPGTKPHYRRDPLRIASARGGEASGTQTSPLLPSATIPSSPRNASAAVRLGRVGEWPQRARGGRIPFPLMGSSDFWSGLHTYSIVSKVGFAPGFAYRRRGDLAEGAMKGSICIRTLYVSLYLKEQDPMIRDGNAPCCSAGSWAKCAGP